jgi:signal transduction histidine kinase/Tfp pilus assembly protein PilF
MRMGETVKKYLIGLALMGIALLSLLPGTDIKEMEERLSRTTGEKRIEILIKLADACKEKEPKKTLKCGKEVLALVRTFPHPKYRLAVLNHMGQANINLGAYEEIGKYGNQALEIAERIGDQQGYADALNNIAWLYRNKGMYREAISHSSRAYKIYVELGNREGVAKALNSTGMIYWKISDYTQALDYLLESCKISETLGNKNGIADSYNNIGIIYWQIKDFDKSLEYYNKGFEIYKELNNKPGVAKLLNNIAIIYSERGKYEDAIRYYEKSLEIKKELGVQSGTANTLNNIGELYGEMKEYHRALEYLTRSLEIKEAIKDRKGVASTLINIGSVYQKLGRYREAIQNVRRGLAIASEINVKEEILQAYEEFSEIYAALNDFSKALDYYRKFKEINDSIFNEQNSKKLAEMRTRYEIEGKEKEIALLKKDREIQQLDLAQHKNLIYSLIIVSVLVLILAFVIYTRYRLRIKTTRALRKEIADRKKAEAELLRSQKLEAVGILAGGIAHDFNNLLGTIIGNLSLAGAEIDDEPEAVVKRLNTAERVSLQASELAQKLVTFSKGGWVLPQRVPLASILKSTIYHYPDTSPLLRGISIPPGLKPIYGDERQLRQVIYNILQNADEAMTEPKKVIINAENIFLDEENLLALKQGDYVKVSITDNGRGVPSDQLGKIFVPYFSTKDTVTQKGMGLGLAICYSIINKHNGHITVTSQVGKGTTVEIYLPAYNEDSVSSKQ